MTREGKWEIDKTFDPELKNTVPVSCKVRVVPDKPEATETIILPYIKLDNWKQYEAISHLVVLYNWFPVIEEYIGKLEESLQQKGIPLPAIVDQQAVSYEQIQDLMRREIGDVRPKLSPKQEDESADNFLHNDPDFISWDAVVASSVSDREPMKMEEIQQFSLADATSGDLKARIAILQRVLDRHKGLDYPPIQKSKESAPESFDRLPDMSESPNQKRAQLALSLDDQSRVGAIISFCLSADWSFKVTSGSYQITVHDPDGIRHAITYEGIPSPNGLWDCFSLAIQDQLTTNTPDSQKIERFRQRYPFVDDAAIHAPITQAVKRSHPDSGFGIEM